MLLHVFVVGPLFGCYARSEFGRDHLCAAAYRGSLDEMRLLLNAGADPSRVGWEEHFTPLAETVRSGEVRAARLLLARGADPNVSNDHGWGKTAAGTLYLDDDVDRTEVIRLIRNAGGR